MTYVSPTTLQLKTGPGSTEGSKPSWGKIDLRTRYANLFQNRYQLKLYLIEISEDSPSS